MIHTIKFEIETLEKLANEPGGLRLLEEYKNNMRFHRDWNGISGIDCLAVRQYLEKLINTKKHSISISDMR
ncbi:MAG: hypothetical protein Q8R36_05565 [bacterium]|nr:hypothetical protein [bacterium]